MNRITNNANSGTALALMGCGVLSLGSLALAAPAQNNQTSAVEIDPAVVIEGIGTDSPLAPFLEAFGPAPAYDLDGDCDVDVQDFLIHLEETPWDVREYLGLMAEWGRQPSEFDTDGDCDVDTVDFLNTLAEMDAAARNKLANIHEGFTPGLAHDYDGDCDVDVEDLLTYLGTYEAPFDITEYLELISEWGPGPSAAQDLDGDCDVDEADYTQAVIDIGNDLANNGG